MSTKKDFETLRHMIRLAAESEPGTENVEAERKIMVNATLAGLNILEQVVNDLHTLAHRKL